MLYVIFRIGDDRYAMEATQIAEVLPLVHIKEIPGAPRGIAGAFDYQGEPVPVVDLTAIAAGRRARQWMSTRLILVNFPEPDGSTHLLGLIAEHATTTRNLRPEDFASSGVAVDEAPFLGPVFTDPAGMIQRIELDQLLPAEVRDRLFREPLGIE